MRPPQSWKVGLRGTVVERRNSFLSVKAEAYRLLGDEASEWMVKPCRLLDGMAPVDLAGTPEGARAVLHELRQASAAFKARTHRNR